MFDEGVQMLEERTSSTCFGVFPHAEGMHLDAEDSLALRTGLSTPSPPGARLAIIHFPHVSNATDFRLLTWADWITGPPPERYDFIILPGTKNTIADLLWLREVGLTDWIRSQHLAGCTVIGVCGGYQMLGRSVRDPSGIESPIREAAGVGLIQATTELTREKQTRAVTATTPRGVTFGGYEIHLGVTSLDSDDEIMPFARLEDGSVDGVRATGVIGTYLHGAFEDPAVFAEVFGVDAPQVISKAAHYQRLGEWVAQHARHLDVLGL